MSCLSNISLAPHALGLAHLVGTPLYLRQHLLHALFANTLGRVALHDIAELLKAELHVVEVLDGLAQLHRDVGQHRLESSESLTSRAAALGVDGLLRHGIVDEDHQAPIRAVDDRIELAVVTGRNEAQYTAVYVGHALLRELPADVGRDSLDVAHHHVHVGEDIVVHALQDVVRLVLFSGFYLVSVVDETFAQRLYLAYGSLVGKTANDGG